MFKLRLTGEPLRTWSRDGSPAATNTPYQQGGPMNKLVLAFKAALGAGVAMALYQLVTSALVFGTIYPDVVLTNSAIGAGLFAVLFSIAHWKMKPTFISSFLTAAALVAGITVLSVWAGAFAGFTLASMISLSVLALAIGSGGFIGARLGSK